MMEDNKETRLSNLTKPIHIRTHRDQYSMHRASIGLYPTQHAQGLHRSVLKTTCTGHTQVWIRTACTGLALVCTKDSMHRASTGLHTRQHAQGLHCSVPDRLLEQREEVDTHSHP